MTLQVVWRNRQTLAQGEGASLEAACDALKVWRKTTIIGGDEGRFPLIQGPTVPGSPYFSNNNNNNNR